jgi:PAS domain S-box-containing protein
MRVSANLVRVLLEGAETVGVRPGQLGLDRAYLSRLGRNAEWQTLAELVDRLAVLLEHDVERLRGVGRSFVRAPSWGFLRGVARTVVSPLRIYDAGTHWLGPASLPHMPLEQIVVSENRLRFRGGIPEPHTPCEPFFHLFEGVLEEIPTLLGLPRAQIRSSHTTPRTLDVVIEVPRSLSLVDRAKRLVRGLLFAGDAVRLLEDQRSELEQGIASLQRANSEAHALFDRLPDLVLIHRNGTVLWINRTVVETLGYEEATEIIERSFFDFVDPSSHALLRSRMHTLMQGRSPPELMEATFLRRDGTPVLVEIFPSEIVSYRGQTARLVFGRDITERVRLQRQLLTADRMASIGMLAAGVAHEVNNPLGYVLNNIEIARKKLGPLGDATRQSHEALGVALEGVDRIRTIVRDLLELSRVDSVAVGPVDVRAVVESTLALAAQKIDERATLRAAYEPVAHARGTASRLGQVLINLVSNALESMPPESRPSNRLDVSVRSSPVGGAIVEVADNGIGIASAHLARIFDPFFTTKRAGAGTGLGLSISQRLVAEMGGALTFDSSPGSGSTFRITLLPTEPEPAEPGPTREVT